MNLIFFPDTTPCPDTESQYTDMNGDVGKELKKLSKGDRELLLRVQTTLKKLKTAGNLDIFFDTQWMLPFNGFLELRIPPTRKKGVFRIYCCRDARNPVNLVLLCAEVKHKKKPMKEEVAKKKYKEYLEMVKNGEM